MKRENVEHKLHLNYSLWIINKKSRNLLSKYEAIKKWAVKFVHHSQMLGYQSGNASKTWFFPPKGNRKQQENSMGSDASSLAPYL